MDVLSIIERVDEKHGSPRVTTDVIPVKLAVLYEFDRRAGIEA
jgi:hypothetical protein